MTVTAVLALEDGTIFSGQSIGAKGNTTGEVVFNTALTGYQEILSDPSYSRQIVTLTYPHIGNTGTTPEDLEAPTAYAAGLVVRDLPPLSSNWRKSEDLREFLVRHKIVAISGINLLKHFMALEPTAMGAGKEHQLMWMVIIHLVFIASGVMLAFMDKLVAATPKH